MENISNLLNVTELLAPTHRLNQVTKAFNKELVVIVSHSKMNINKTLMPVLYEWVPEEITYFIASSIDGL